MRYQKLIAKIALGISVAALVFSLVTLGKSIVLGKGVFLSLILILGTGIVVFICALLLRVDSGYDEDEEVSGEEYEDDKDDSGHAQPDELPLVYKKSAEPPEMIPERKKERESKDIEREVDSLISQLEADDPYDLSNFE